MSASIWHSSGLADLLVPVDTDQVQRPLELESVPQHKVMNLVCFEVKEKTLCAALGYN